MQGLKFPLEVDWNIAYLEEFVTDDKRQIHNSWTKNTSGPWGTMVDQCTTKRLKTTRGRTVHKGTKTILQKRKTLGAIIGFDTNPGISSINSRPKHNSNMRRIRSGRLI